MKKSVVIVSILLVLMLLVSACSTPTGGEGQSDTAQVGKESGDAWVGGYVCHSANVFFDAIEKGLIEMAKQTNGTIIRQDSELDLQAEMGIVESFIEQGVDVIFLTPNDPVGSVESVLLANEANIPVIVISSELSGENFEVLATIKSDDYTAAGDVAKYAMEQIGGEGKVLILNGMQTSDVIDRIKGYKDVIATYPDVEIANEVMVDVNSVAACTTSIENMLMACPDAKAILCFNGFGIPAAYAALENLNIDTNSVSVVDVDGLQAEADLLAGGEMKISAAMGQDTPGFGRQAVEVYLDYIKAPSSWDFGKLVEVPTIMITPENAAEYDIYK